LDRDSVSLLYSSAKQSSRNESILIVVT